MVFNESFLDVRAYHSLSRMPNFENIIKILKKQAPDRPTLFEFMLSQAVMDAFTAEKSYTGSDVIKYLKRLTDTFHLCGYDFTCFHGSDFSFASDRKKEDEKSTLSLNEGFVINDRKSFENYQWQDPAKFDYSRISEIGKYMPDGMKIIICGPCGLLENVISLVGYENLCFMLYDDPELAEQVFNEVGSRLLKYYELSVGYDAVGALMSNDDWGFNTQTMLSVEQMRRLVFPWHKKFAELAHDYGKPICLHSCGKFDDVADDIAHVMQYDGRHSYEDNILPVEQAYEKYKEHFAILGGIDIDFLYRKTPAEIYERCRSMVTNAKTGYALGSGNSIAPYIPLENYLAMISAALFE